MAPKKGPGQDPQVGLDDESRRGLREMGLGDFRSDGRRRNSHGQPRAAAVNQRRALSVQGLGAPGTCILGPSCTADGALPSCHASDARAGGLQQRDGERGSEQLRALAPSAPRGHACPARTRARRRGGAQRPPPAARRRDAGRGWARTPELRRPHRIPRERSLPGSTSCPRGDCGSARRPQAPGQAQARGAHGGRAPPSPGPAAEGEPAHHRRGPRPRLRPGGGGRG